MIDIDKMSALVNVQEIKELNKEYEKRGEIIEFYEDEVLKNLELFLTFWYEESSEFGKIKDSFNDHDEFPCELRVRNGRVKIKMTNTDNEEDNSSS